MAIKRPRTKMLIITGLAAVATLGAVSAISFVIEPNNLRKKFETAAQNIAYEESKKHCLAEMKNINNCSSFTTSISTIERNSGNYWIVYSYIDGRLYSSSVVKRYELSENRMYIEDFQLNDGE